MRYVVVGAGAVGGVVGARLHEAGHEVTLIARGEHLAAVQRDGLVVDRADGRRVVAARAVAGPAEVGWSGGPTVVLLCVKSHQTQAALDDLALHAPTDTVVVCVQNGLHNEDEVLRRFARAYSVCVMLPCTHLEPGVVVEKSAGAPGILDVGRVAGGVDDVAEQVAADLRGAGFESVARADVVAWKRRKLLMNLANGVDAAFVPGAAADALAGHARAEAEALLADLGLACVSAEQDAGRRGDHLRRRDDLGDGAYDGGSTWQSLTRGAASEIDYLSGEVVLLGRRHGVPVPYNEAVQSATRSLAARGAAARSLDADAVLARITRLAGSGDDEGPAT